MKERILLAGDTHGQLGHVRNVFAHACRRNVGKIIQLGDYGFGWRFTQFKGTDGKVEDEFTGKVSKLAVETGIPLYWIDGNHENFDAIESLTAELEPEEDGTYQIAPMIFYIPRGTRLEIGGVSFLCCGGATSIDQGSRTLGVSYWIQELINLNDVEKCAAAGPVDVLLSHDFPLECEVLDRHLDPYWGEKAQREVLQNRKMVSEILRDCEARRVFHGHLHIYYDEIIDIEGRQVHVTGLANDGCSMADSTYVLEIEEGAWQRVV